MTGLTELPDGWLITGDRYRLELGGELARLSDQDGAVWAGFRLLAAVDTTEGRDEITEFGVPRVRRAGDAVEVRVTHRSSRWDRLTVALDCHDDRISVWARVHGTGRIDRVHLLRGWGAAAGRPLGDLPSVAHFGTLFSANPTDPSRIVLPATESAVIGVTGDGRPGRGHFFFTPAPMYYAVSRVAAADPATLPPGPWLGFGLAVPVEQATFTGWHYRGVDGGFGFRLDYEGHTEATGEFRSPTLLVRPGTVDPYRGIRAHRDWLTDAGMAPPPDPRPVPRWWAEPMFCGWGAQSHLATVRGGRAAEQCTQANYDGFLTHLAAHGIRPGTVVVDDKWQRAYARPDPEPRRWPDLPGWIAGRHDAGQKVLLWWRAWSPEGAPAELCVRDAHGRPVVLDPEHPGAVELLSESIGQLLAPDGLDADGLKVDFTASTPTGAALTHHGSRWGVALLHELLAVIYRTAKRAKPDALVVTQTPDPSFVDVLDAVRLNDMLRLDDPRPAVRVVEQMRYRAAVASAACPEVLVDTDDWCAPDLAGWRAYLAVKAELGVPALYYASHLDRTGEQLTDDDLAMVREVWSAYRAGIADRPAAADPSTHRFGIDHRSADDYGPRGNDPM